MFHDLIPGSSRPASSHDTKVVAGDLLEGNRHKPRYHSGFERCLPFIATCLVEGSGVGACRKMTTSEGGEITDIIQEMDSTTRRLVYARVKSPFPVTSYRGTVEVFESFDSMAIVAWTIDFESDPEESRSVAELVKEAISAGLDGMERDLQSSSNIGSEA
jgi:hypothetical protein